MRLAPWNFRERSPSGMLGWGFPSGGGSCCGGGGETFYCFAGTNNTGASKRNDEYSSADSWTARTDLPLPTRSNMGVCALAGLGYSIAQSNTIGGTLRDNDEYTKPATDSWASRTDHPAPTRSLFDGAVGISDKAYMMFGSEVNNTPAPSTPHFYQDCDEYTPPGSDSWAAKTDGPTPARATGASAATSTRAFHVGGINSSAGAVFYQDNDSYDPSGDSWTNKTDLPSPTRRAPACDILSGLIYIMGGDNGTVHADNDEYDPTGDSYTAKTDVPFNRGFSQIAGISGALFLHGGTSNLSDIVGTNSEYVPDTWTSKTAMTVVTRAGGSTAL